MSGRPLGGGPTRVIDAPADASRGVLDARAPRAEGTTGAERSGRADDDARRAGRLFDAAPEGAVAVFVDDATIPFQHESGGVRRLTGYCDRADVAVLNAFESDEPGSGDPVSRRERSVLATFRQWADRLVELRH